MSNLLGSLASDNTIEAEVDSVGSNFSTLESDIYDFNIDLAYIDKSAGGAMALNLHLTDEAGNNLRTKLWMTSGDSKGNKNYYEKDGKKFYLPGFSQANAMCLLTVGKEISTLDTEEKVVKLYDFEAKKEVPTPVQVITDILNQRIAVGVLKQTVDKNVKGADGKYVASGETRDQNEIDKVFRSADGLTVAEIRADAGKGEATAVFRQTWLDKHQGKTQNRAKGAADGAKAGAPTGAAKAPTDLFN